MEYLIGLIAVIIAFLVWCDRSEETKKENAKIARHNRAKELFATSETRIIQSEFWRNLKEWVIENADNIFDIEVSGGYDCRVKFECGGTRERPLVHEVVVGNIGHDTSKAYADRSAILKLCSETINSYSENNVFKFHYEIENFDFRSEWISNSITSSTKKYPSSHVDPFHK